MRLLDESIRSDAPYVFEFVWIRVHSWFQAIYFFHMILAIESSCDESALALFDPEKGVEGEWVHSQISLHQEYGGVVPDLASREHLKNFFL